MYKTIIITLLLFQSLDSFGLTGDEILEKVDEIRSPGGSYSFNIDVKNYRKNKETINKLKVYVREYKNSIAKWESPKRAIGQALLMVDDDMWLYLTTTQRAIRISPRQKLMGQVSYGDVLKVVFSLDYTSEIAGEEEVEERECIKLDLKAKSKSSTYDKVVLWVDKKNHKPVKSDFYTKTGILLKSLIYKEYKVMHGRERPSVLYFYDMLRKNEYSIVTYSNMKMKTLPSVYFQKNYLNRLR